MPDPFQRTPLSARFAAGLVRGYQLFLSPLQRCFGANAGCRFAPGCSEYAKEALLTHGIVRGSWLAICRIGRCHPFHPGGHDPVPPGRYVPGRMFRPHVEG